MHCVLLATAYWLYAFWLITSDVSKRVPPYTVFAWDDHHVANSFKCTRTAKQTQYSDNTSPLTDCAVIDRQNLTVITTRINGSLVSTAHLPQSVSRRRCLQCPVTTSMHIGPYLFTQKLRLSPRFFPDHCSFWRDQSTFASETWYFFWVTFIPWSTQVDPV